MAIELLLQLLHAVAAMSGHFQQRITQLAVYAEHAVEGHGVLLIQQVGLVQQQQRTDAGVLGGYQVAVDQVGVGLRQRREDDHDQVDVGSHRLELAAGVRAAEFGAAWQLRDDHANALFAGAPHHLVTSDHGRQVGAQVATEYLAGQFTIQGFYFDLDAEVRDDQAGLFRAEVAAFKNLYRLRLALGGAGSTLALDFFDTPVLPAVELAFGHGSSES